MGRQVNGGRDKSALDLMEEAGYVLRNAPPQAVASYYIGTLPFLLAFLFFWADMGRNPYAYEHCAPAAFGLAILFAWMSAWQAVFAQALRSHLTGAPPAPFGKLVFIEAVLQPTKFIVIPLAFLVTVPFAGAFAFYQNLFAISYRGDTGVRQACAASWRQARLRPIQNWTVLGIAAMLAIVVFANVAVALILAPQLLKSLLGIETPLTQGAVSPLNSTFLAIALALTYAILDPLIKTIYVLRCFYGESLGSGEDLRARMNAIREQIPKPASSPSRADLQSASRAQPNSRSVSPTEWSRPPGLQPPFRDAPTTRPGRRTQTRASAPPLPCTAGWQPAADCQSASPAQPNTRPVSLPARLPRRVGLWPALRLFQHAADPLTSDACGAPSAAVVLLILALCTAPPARAQQTPAPQPAAPALNQRQLDRSIDDVLKRSEFTWRLPPSPHRQENKSWIMRTLSAWFDKMAEWWDHLIDWLNEKARSHRVNAPEKGRPPALRPWYYALGGAIVVITLFAFLRSFRRRKGAAAQAEAIVVATPDLTSEETSADQLPADEWLRTARECAARNDVRLAVRAFYLATLAYLGGSSLIAIGRGKTNQEYQRELRRRAKARPEILPAFSDTVGIFERSWYGLYDVDADAMARVEANLAAMRPHVE